jgi:hypothetical protein
LFLIHLKIGACYTANKDNQGLEKNPTGSTRIHQPANSTIYFHSSHTCKSKKS